MSIGRAGAFLALALLAATPALADAPDCRDTGITAPSPANSHKMSADDYPMLSVALSEEGNVELELLVAADGKVASARVRQSSGHSRLDDAARTHAQSDWRYVPAMRGGKPVACRWLAMVAWRITDGPLGDFSGINTVKMGPDDYPAAAKAAHEEGMTGIVLHVNEQGIVTRTVVAKPSGYPDLDAAALERASAAHVDVVMVNGKPAQASIPLMYVWTLEP